MKSVILTFMLTLTACSSDTVSHGASLMQACTHVCACMLADAGADAVGACSSNCSALVSQSGWFSSSLSVTTSTPSLGSGVPPSQACLDCIASAQCLALEAPHPCASVCPR